MTHTPPSPTLIIACVDENPRMVVLLRAAKQKAKELGIGWQAIHIDQPKYMEKNKEKATLILQNLTLAEQMGAIVYHFEAHSIAKGIAGFVSRMQARPGAVFMFIGETASNRLTIFKKPLSVQLSPILPQGSIIEIITFTTQFIPPRRTWDERLWIKDISLVSMIYAMLSVASATLLIEIVDYLFPYATELQARNKPIVYMMASTLIAGRFGLMAGLVSAVAGFVIMDFFYIEPRYSLMLQNATDAMSLGLYLVASVLITLFASRNHVQNSRLRKQVHRLHSLFRMYRASLSQRSRQQVVEDLYQEIQSALGTDIIFFLPAVDNAGQLQMVYPKNMALTEEETKALALSWEKAKVTGYGSVHYPLSRYRFKPLLTGVDNKGVIAIRINETLALDPATSQLLGTTVDHIAFILERVELGQIMEKNVVSEEREKLRSMLLSSVSHDLKTPLASVIGSLSVYRSMGQSLPEEQRVILINTALEEAQRLDSFITNILDMTRIETGKIEFKKEWIKPLDMFKAVQKRLRERLKDHTVVYAPSNNNAIEVCTDSVMTSQVLQNVLDNAGKYTPPGSVINIGWHVSQAGLVVEVHDNGIGIPESHREMIFDKYTRLKRQDSQVAGTGLGLAISRSVMNAQKGSIVAGNHANGGAVFTLTFPLWRQGEEEMKAA